MKEIIIKKTEFKQVEGPDYQDMFSKTKPVCEQPQNISIKEKALEIALDTRKFEIGLYWERAKYFWTLLGITFGAYIGNFLVLANEQTLDGLSQTQKLVLSAFIPMIISALGIVLSWAWYCVNKGSKYWQENWENHVALLEDDYIGPLFKTLVEKTESDTNEKTTKEKTTDPIRYSVSKINILVSRFVFLIWLMLGLYAFINGLFGIFDYFAWDVSTPLPNMYCTICKALIVFISYTFICCLLIRYIYRIKSTNNDN